MNDSYMKILESAKTIEIKDPDVGVEGYIVITDNSTPINFGGFRMDESISKQVVQDLAICMSLKLAQHNVQVGGAKGGIKLNPRSADAKKKLKIFAERASSALKENVILGKDVGATDDLVDYLYECLGVRQLHLVNAPGMPSRIRDLEGYIKHMTARGVLCSTQSALKKSVYGKKVLIQGSGAVGAGCFWRFNQQGAKIIAVSDVNTTIFNPSGISPDDFSRVCSGGKLSRVPGTNLEYLSSKDICDLAADILIVAANSHSIDSTLAKKIRVPLIVEGANFGLCDDSREIIHDKGITVVPDLIASSSSAAMVTTQISFKNAKPTEQLWHSIEESIDRSVTSCVEKSRITKKDLRSSYLEIYGPLVLSKITGGNRETRRLVA